MVGVEVVGGNHQTTDGEGCCRWAHQTVRCPTEHCPVRQPRHPTVKVRELLTLALSFSGTGQSGAAPDRHCSLFGAPLMGGFYSARIVLHCSSDSPAFTVDHCAKESLLRWCTG
jgi:hypothetical protein